MTKQITVAFAGPGDMKEDAIKDLLNDYFHFGPEDADGIPEESEDDITLIFPVARGWSHKGLDKVLGWSEYADMPFIAITNDDTTKGMSGVLDDASEVIVTKDIAEEIIDTLVKAEGESVLIVLWPADEDEEVAEHYEVLVDLALQEEIKTLSLGDALDTIRIKDDEPVAPEPEPEPEPPARGRGRRRAAAAEPDETPALAKDVEPEAPTRGRSRRKAAEEPLEPTEEPLTEADVSPEPEKPARRSRTAAQNKETADNALSSLREARSRVPLAKETVEPAPAPQNGTEDHTAVALRYAENIATYFRTAEANRQAANPGVHVEPSVISVQAVALLHLLNGDTAAIETGLLENKIVETDEPRRGRGRPRKDGSPAQPRSEEDKGTPYIVEDGRYRKAGPGRKPRGQVRESLSPERIADLTEQGLIDEE